MSMESYITPTHIWYYYICKREVWLLAHGLDASQENPYLEIGRALQEHTYKRDRKEIAAEGMKIDLMKKREGDVIIAEVKKSSRYIKSAKMQLAFYLYKLKQQGVEMKGELLIPKEKKRIKVELDDVLEQELENAIAEIEKILALEHPPKAERVRWCTKCAYSEFCWA